MSTGLLKHKRCFNHADREASARCPSCKNDFCRECITEHDGRMLCVNCLKKTFLKKKSQNKLIVPIIYTLMLTAALMVIFLCFIWLGRTIAFSKVSNHASHAQP